MKLSELIKKYREENNLSARQFSKRCGLSNAYISLIENEETKSPTMETYKKIALAMNLELEELIDLLDDNETIIVKAKADISNSLEKELLSKDAQLKLSQLSSDAIKEIEKYIDYIHEMNENHFSYGLPNRTNNMSYRNNKQINRRNKSKE